MAKKEMQLEHWVYLLVDPESGFTAVFNSEDAADEAALSIGSHTKTKLGVIKTRYYYDRMWDIETIIQQVAPKT